MDYWTECISEAFDDAGIDATPDQIQAVVGFVVGAHENYGMAHGHDCIPNPLESEVRRLGESVKEARAETDRANDDFRKNVAMRRGCETHDVVLDGNGYATYRR